MTQSRFGFYFERAGRAATQGAIAPAEQYFEGSRAEVSVVRETGQNSLDAVHGYGRCAWSSNSGTCRQIPSLESRGSGNI